MNLQDMFRGNRLLKQSQKLPILPYKAILTPISWVTEMNRGPVAEPSQDRITFGPPITMYLLWMARGFWRLCLDRLTSARGDLVGYWSLAMAMKVA